MHLMRSVFSRVMGLIGIFVLISPFLFVVSSVEGAILVVRDRIETKPPSHRSNRLNRRPFSRSSSQPSKKPTTLQIVYGGYDSIADFYDVWKAKQKPRYVEGDYANGACIRY